MFALHSDYSLVVVPMHPASTATWIAVNRIAQDGRTVMGEGERIGVDRALRAVTVDAAYVLGMERADRQPGAGQVGDFAILEEDPYEADPDAAEGHPRLGHGAGRPPASRPEPSHPEAGHGTRGVPVPSACGRARHGRARRNGPRGVAVKVEAGR